MIRLDSSLIDNKLEKIKDQNRINNEKQIDFLQRELDAEKERHKETRFWATFIIVGMFDVIALANASFLLIVGVFVMEIIGILCLAKRLGQEEVVKYFTLISKLAIRYIKSLINRNNRKSPKN